MNPAVLSFAGPIASGKTTLSKAISRRFGWKYVSFGEYIKKVATRRGYDPVSREIMQDIGNELIDNGWKKFCNSVLDDAHWVKGEGLVIDGIRHVEGLMTIKIIAAPQAVYLIYVFITEEIRRVRLLQKDIPIENIDLIESHSTEKDVRDALRKRANIIVDGKDTVQFNSNIICSWLLHQNRY
jgi:dephospho-CoA kinase